MSRGQNDNVPREARDVAVGNRDIQKLPSYEKELAIPDAPLLNEWVEEC